MSLSQSSEINLTDNGRQALNAKALANSARSAADNAYNLANGAQRTADGKNSIYRGLDPSTAPTSGLKEGDLYFTDNAIHTWNGSTWEKTVSDTTGAEVHAKVEAAMEESHKAVNELKTNIESKVKELDYDVESTRTNLTEVTNKIANDLSATKVDLADTKTSLTSSLDNAKKDIATTTSDLNSVKTSLADTRSSLATTANDLTNVKADLADTKNNLTTTTNDIKNGLSAVSNDLSATKTNLENTKNSLSTTVANLQKQTGQLSGSLETANSKIKYNSNAISKVSQTADAIRADLTNTKGDVASVKATASSLTSSITNAQGDISNLQQRADSITSTLSNGGVNLLSGTSDFSWPLAWWAGSGSSSINQSDTYNDSEKVTEHKCVMKPEEWQGIWWGGNDTAGQTYTLSFDARCDNGKAKISLMGLEGNFSTDAPLTTEWVRYHVSGKVTSGGHNWVTYFSTTESDNVYTRKYQIEYGDTATPWKPSNGDISSLQQTAQGLTSRVGNAEGNISQLQQTANGLTSTVSNLHAGDRNLARGVASSKDWVVFQGFNNSENYWRDLITYSLDTLKAGDKVTFGITMKNEGVTSGTMVFQQHGDVSVWNRDFGWISPAGNVTDFVPNGAEKALTYTITITDGMLNGNSRYNIVVRTDNVPAGGKLSFRYAFVKKGTMATDWTPAPEDTDKAISKVSQTADAIRADLTNTKGDVASVKATASSLQSQITDNKNNISSVKQTADSLTSTVGQMPAQWQQAINDKASAQVLDSNVDMNNLTTAGTYLIRDFSVKNAPIGAWFMATVEATADHTRVVQRVKRDDSNVAYERSNYNNGWTAWERVATGTDVSSIQQTMSGITTRVSNAEGNVSKLEQTASGLQTQITNTKDDVASVKVTADSVRTDLTNANHDIASVKAKADSLTSSIANANDQISTLQQRADSITSTLSNGGRNLLSNTREINDPSIWVNLWAWDKVDFYHDGRNDCQIVQTSTRTWDGLKQYVYVEAGKKYTFSIDAKSGDNSNHSAYFFTNLNSAQEGQYNSADVTGWMQTLTYTPTWTRYSFTITATTNGYVAPRIERGTTTNELLQLARPQFEYGETATPWKPSNGDISSLQQTAQGLTSRVGNAEGNISQLQQTATGLQSTVQSQSGQISQLQQDADGLSATVGGAAIDLISNLDQPFVMGFGIPNTTWDGYNACITLPTTSITHEVLPQDGTKFATFYNWEAGKTYMQSIIFETDAKVTDGMQWTWYTANHHMLEKTTLVKLGNNTYRLIGSHTPTSSEAANPLRVFDIFNFTDIVDVTTGTYLKFRNPRIWCPDDNSLAQLKLTADGLTSKVSDAEGNVSGLQQTASKLQSDLTNAKGDISSLQQTANGLTSTVSNLHAGDRNLARGVASSKDWFVFQGFNNYENYCYWNLADYPLETLKAGDKVTFGITMKNEGVTSGTMVFQQYGDVSHWTRDYSAFSSPGNVTDFVPNGAEKALTYTITITDGMLNGNTSYSVSIRTDNVPAGGKLSFRYAFVKKGTLATDWTPAPEDVDDSVSQIKQTADSLNAYVKGSKGSDTLKSILSMDPNNSSIAQVVNGQIAAAIGTYSDGSVRIDGKALHITADTKIEKATIKSAMIDSIEANKIKAGVLDASQITVINLDANSITTGSLSAVVNDLRQFEEYTVSASSPWDFDFLPSSYGNWFLAGDADHVYDGPSYFWDRNQKVAPYMYVTSRGTTDGKKITVTVWKDNDPTQYQRVWDGDSKIWSNWVILPNSQNLVSTINLNPDGVKISGKKIELDGNTTVTGRLDLMQKKSNWVDQDKKYHNNWKWRNAHIYFDNYLQLLGENCDVTYTDTKTHLGGNRNFYSVTTLTPGYLKFTAYPHKINISDENFDGQISRSYLDSGRLETPEVYTDNMALVGHKIMSRDGGSLYVSNKTGDNFDGHGDVGFQVWAGIGLGKRTIYMPDNDLYIQQGNCGPGLGVHYSRAGKVDVHCNRVISQRANTVSSRLSVKTDITPVSYDRALAAVAGTEMYDYRYTTDDTGQHYVSGIIDDVNPDPQYHMDDMLINKERTARIDANLVGYHHVVLQELLKKIDKLEIKLKSLETILESKEN